MGFGDSIMVTGIARKVREKYPDLQIVVGEKSKGKVHYSDMFKNNPNILSESEIDINKKKIWIESVSGKRPYISFATEKKFYWNSEHVPFKGELFFDKNEINFAKNILKRIKSNQNKKIVFIEPSRAIRVFSKKNVFDGEKNRIWKIERWQKIVDHCKNNFLFIQPQYEGYQPIKNVYKFPSDFRQACSVMSLCDFFIGWEGGFAHAAAALDKKSVVLFGGFIHPNITGYKFHNNIYIDIDGSPCGMRDWCEHCEKCKDLITVEMVLNEFNKIISI